MGKSNLLNKTNPSPSKDVNLSRVEALILKSVFLLVLILTLFDVWHDFTSHSPAVHFITDISLSAIIMVALGILIYRTAKKEDDLVNLKLAYEHAQESHAKEKSLILKNFGEYIDHQLGEWKLTQAEKEIATLLLKGLSHQEIAEIRSTSERTVRQQSLNVYAKSGLRGRSDLAAFFLEDILNVPPMQVKVEKVNNIGS